MIKRVIQFARQGYRDLEFDTYDTDWESEAYLTVSGQNSNNSVRVTDAFLHAVEADGEWSLTRRLDGKIHKTLKAADLWEKIGYAAWACADPGLQYHTTINDWHTCPESGPISARIRARNTCSSTTPPAISRRSTCCRSATPRRAAFDVASFEHAVRLWTLMLEISVLMAQFPSQGDRPAVLRLPHARPRLRQYRRPADGCGIAYDSDEGRAICGALSADHDRPRLRHLGRDRRQARRLPRLRAQRQGDAARHPQPPARRRRPRRRLRELSVAPTPLDHASLDKAGIAWADLSAAARAAWADALALGEAHGYRNAQVTVVAPTGTIGLVMDCDTTGIEPDFALVKFKKLAGGGYFKIINRAVPEALRALGYAEAKIGEIVAYAVGHASLGQAPGVNAASLRAKGFTDARSWPRSRRRSPAPSTSASSSTTGRSATTSCTGTLKIPAEKLDEPGFDLLTPSRLHQEPRSRPPTSTSAAR